MNKFNLIEAEGHWDQYSNNTVKGLFDLLSDLFKSKSAVYKYVQFADPAGFDSCIKQIHDHDTHRYLYIGSHGDDDGIYGAAKSKPLSFTAIKNRILPYQGLYLGTCSFGQVATLFKFVDETKLLGAQDTRTISTGSTHPGSTWRSGRYSKNIMVMAERNRN